MASTRRSEEHTSELQSHSEISYGVFCLKKKKTECNPADRLQPLESSQYFLLQRSRSQRRLRWFFFFNDTATTDLYTLSYTLSPHDALPISSPNRRSRDVAGSRNESVLDRVRGGDRKSTRLNSSHIQKSRMPSSARKKT